MDDIRERARRQWQMEEQANETIRTRLDWKHAEATGFAVMDASLEQAQSVLFGNCRVECTKKKGSLPHLTLVPGDKVAFCYTDSLTPVQITEIYKLTPSSIWVTKKESMDWYTNLGLIKISDAVAGKRLFRAIEATSTAVLSRMHRILLRTSSPRVRANMPHTPPMYNTQLSERQIAAVDFATNVCDEVSVISGPAGSGKTSVVVEIVQRLVARREKILISAGSWSSLNVLRERLSDKVECLKIDCEAREEKPAVAGSLEYEVQQIDLYQKLIAINEEIGKIERDIYFESIECGEIPSLPKLKKARKRAKELSLQGVITALTNASAVLSPLTAPYLLHALKATHPTPLFDTVIIDDCNLASEVAAWLPALAGRRVVLIGDLAGPFPASFNPSIDNESFLHRLSSAYPETHYQLDVQYRVQPTLWECPNTCFYGGMVTPSRLISSESQPAISPLIFVDTTGCEMRESGSSAPIKYNIGEASVVAVLLQELREVGIVDVAVISPFCAQVQYMKSQSMQANICTVAEMQGREADAVILSLVRSSDRWDAEPLLNDGMLILAMTRARKVLCIVGDSNTMSESRACPALRSLESYLYEYADVRAVQAYYAENPQVLLNQGDFTH